MKESHGFIPTVIGVEELIPIYRGKFHREPLKSLEGFPVGLGQRVDACGPSCREKEEEETNRFQ